MELHDSGNVCPVWNSHNRLSAFGVIGTASNAGSTQRLFQCHNRLSAFGVIGTFYSLPPAEQVEECSHNRLSAFGVIGTLAFMRRLTEGQLVTIAFRLLG